MNGAINTQADPTRMSLPQRSRHASMTLVLAMIASASCLPALATELVPSRNTAAPGDSVHVAVNPPLNATMPAGARLYLARSDVVASTKGAELRIAEWKGDSFVAVFPCNAYYDDAMVPLILVREFDDGRDNRIHGRLASSAVRGHFLRVKTGNAANCAGRAQPNSSTASAARGSASGPLSRRPVPRESSPSVTPR
jgi:hypothetical protein